MPEYTLAELNRLIQLAKMLGFQDDVEHWTTKRAELIARLFGNAAVNS